MAPRNSVTILENSHVAPAPGAVPELSLPLTCSDMAWIGFPPIHRLVFYQHPVSRECFSDTIIPGLRNSLSLALKHFPSVAGNLIIPSDFTEPVIRYMVGNSVQFTIAEASSHDFEDFVVNKPRFRSEVYPLIPHLPKSSESGGSKIYPLFAIQVTIFPGEGFCIGITHNHILGDGTSTYSFTKAWSTICQVGENEAAKRNVLSPIYDRAVMKVHTKEVDDIVWRDLRNKMLKEGDMNGMFNSLEGGTERVHTVFFLSLEDIQKLKKRVSDRKTSVQHLSSFTVICAYVWTCLINSDNHLVNIVDDDEEQYFMFPADFRGRAEPLVSGNYFGNCLVGCLTKANTTKLSGNEAFFNATELIGNSIHQKLSCDVAREGFKFYLNSLVEVKDMTKLFSVGGSPRHNYYGMDFGWGKPRKVEITSIDLTGAMSLSGSRDTSGGVEIGMALPKEKMDIFTEIFYKGLLGL